MAPMHNPEQGIQDKPTSAEPSATAIQTKAPAPPATAGAAPAATVKPVALPQPSRTSPLDPVLLALLLVFAFLLASFAVANSDFWMHLATGRLIAQGEYQFGHDPFSYASEGPWINQSWLFDWLLYGVYTLGGGTALVVVKALVFVALIMLLFQIRRRDGSWLLPILVLTLAALAMHTRLLLQPTILSYLLFAAMLWLLFGEPGPAPTGARRLWWLPALFALWVNVDSWFVVGPLTLALVLLGSWLQRLTGGASLHAPKQLAAVLGVGLLACLLNPHHVRAFQLPYELAHPLAELGDLLRIPLPDSLVAGGRAMQQIIEFEPQSSQIYGVFRRPFLQPNVPPNEHAWILSPLAYFPLLLLTAASFVLHTPAVPNAGPFPWARLLPWVFFTLLTFVQARVVPFAAMLSVPAAVLNIQDYVRRRQTTAALSTLPRLLTLSRVGMALALAGLLFLAWPGWLYARAGDPQSPRRVAWQLQPDSSMKQTALALRELHQAGKLRNGFNFQPELAFYSAWYSPEIRWFFDYRFTLFPTSAARYGKMRANLRGEAKAFLEGQPLGLDEWGQLTRTDDVNFLTVQAAAGTSGDALIYRRWVDERHWPMVYEDGQTLAFGWNPEGGAGAAAKTDFTATAFGQVPAEWRTPDTGPELPAKARGFWRDYAFGLPRTPLVRKEVDLYQRYFRFSRMRWVEPYAIAWALTIYHGPAAGSAVAPATATVPHSARLSAVLWRELMQRPPRGRDIGDPALPILMVRAARTALEQSPDDPSSYGVLFEAVNTLRDQENHWAQSAVEPVFVWYPKRGLSTGELRATLRHVQALAALNAYITLEPKNPKVANVHVLLGEMYARMNFLDAMQEQWTQALRLIDRERPPDTARKEELKAFDERKKGMRLTLDDLNAELKRRRENFDLHYARLDVLRRIQALLLDRYKVEDPKTGKARLDRNMGLAKLALKTLTDIPAEELKREDPRIVGFIAHTQMGLMLMLGRGREVREALADQHGWLETFKKVLNPIDFYHLRESLYLIQFWAAGAAGDYPAMDDALAQLESNLPGVAQQVKQVRELLISHLSLGPFIAELARVDSWVAQNTVAATLQRAAELRVMRGLIALERGDTVEAAQHFQRALESRIGFSDRAIAVRYLELLRRK